MFVTFDLKGSAIFFIVNEFVNSSDTFSPNTLFFPEPWLGELYWPWELTTAVFWVIYDAVYLESKLSILEYGEFAEGTTGAWVLYEFSTWGLYIKSWVKLEL